MSPTIYTKATALNATLTRTLKRIPTPIRGHIVAILGEYIGTGLFLFFAFAGTQVANISASAKNGTGDARGSPEQLLYISLAFGFSLAVNAWVFSRVSGGLFNPAVTLGMCLIGAITIFRAALLFIAQMLGAITAAAIVSALTYGTLDVSTTLNSRTSVAQGTMLEMLLTLQLVFEIFLLAAEKHAGNFIAPVGIGLSLFFAEMTGVFWTGGSLNPARSFAPAVVLRGFESEQWIYWVGPCSGAVLAVGLLKVIRGLEYGVVNGETEGLLSYLVEESLAIGRPVPVLGREGEGESASRENLTRVEDGRRGDGDVDVERQGQVVPKNG